MLVWVLTAFRIFWHIYIRVDQNQRTIVVASTWMLLGQQVFGNAYFYDLLLSLQLYTVHYEDIQSKRNMLLCATSGRDYEQQHWIEMLAMPSHNTTRPVSGLLHQVHRYHDIRFNIVYISIQKRVKQKLSTRISLPVITKYMRPYFQHLVAKGLI